MDQQKRLSECLEDVLAYIFVDEKRALYRVTKNVIALKRLGIYEEVFYKALLVSKNLLQVEPNFDIDVMALRRLLSYADRGRFASCSGLALPSSSLLLYRGVGGDESANYGLSWTDDPEEAAYWAYVYEHALGDAGEARILVTVAEPKHIYAVRKYPVPSEQGIKRTEYICLLPRDQELWEMKRETQDQIPYQHKAKGNRYQGT